ncbi:MAG: porin, partial [Gammaproteobacteria bacterium]
MNVRQGIKQLFLSILMIGSMSGVAKANTSSTSGTQPTTFTSISSNPAAVNSVTGSGAAEQYIEKLLGI